MKRVLVANRGEIAVRIIRACKDLGLASVAVFSDQDRGAPHVSLGDEAHPLNGSRAADTYLSISKLISIARRTGADAVHPGYGFLSEIPEFAIAVEEAGLRWIGPPATAMSALSDKVSARRIAGAVGAPLVDSLDDSELTTSNVETFAARHGLPIAIKAKYGGGGRGLRVVEALDDFEGALDSARREAEASFGSSECFVERYLERARHVETQCLADESGSVVVVSTRDCTVQRRHQKLIEEAPAPFLSFDQKEVLRESSRRILGEVGYVGAGTCEFLMARDGSLFFLEVNTRLQVEHPVTEEVTDIDLVVETLRLAIGEEIGYSDPDPTGHAVEFRVNAEDPTRAFSPESGTISSWTVPGGPGVRIDSGYVQGQQVPGEFDPLLAKLIVRGRDRGEAFRRASRALSEFVVEGVATTLDFHRHAVERPELVTSDASEFEIHTRWAETLAIDLWPETDRAETPASSSTENLIGVQAPSQGTLVDVRVDVGDEVEQGQSVAVLEAMKMEQEIVSRHNGIVNSVPISAGSAIRKGDVICWLQSATD